MGSGLITVFIKGTPKLDRDPVADTGGSGSPLLESAANVAANLQHGDTLGSRAFYVWENQCVTLFICFTGASQGMETF